MDVAKARTLGAIVESRRRELGLSQEDLAERIGDGITQSQLSRLERGGVKLPRRERMERIAAALDLPLGELLARSGWAEAETHIRTAPATAVLSRSDPPPIPDDDPFYSLMMLEYRRLTPAGRQFLVEQARRLRQMQEAIRREAEGSNEADR